MPQPSKPFWPPMTLRVYGLPCHSPAANIAHLTHLLATINQTPGSPLPITHPDFLPPDLFVALPGQPHKGRRFHDTQARVVFKDPLQSIYPYISAVAAGPLAEDHRSLTLLAMMERLRRRLTALGLEVAWASAPTDRTHWARAFFNHVAGPNSAPTNHDVLVAAKAHFRTHGILLDYVCGDFERGERAGLDPNLFFIFASPSHAARAMQLGNFALRIGAAEWHTRVFEYPYSIPAVNPYTMAMRAGCGALSYVRDEVDAALVAFNRTAARPASIVLCDEPLSDDTWVRVAVDSLAACEHVLANVVFRSGSSDHTFELVYDLNERSLKPPKRPAETLLEKRTFDAFVRSLQSKVAEFSAEQARREATLVEQQSQTATMGSLNNNLRRVDGNVERHQDRISALHDQLAHYTVLNAGDGSGALVPVIQNARRQLADCEGAIRDAKVEREAIMKRKGEVEAKQPAPLRPLVIPTIVTSQIEAAQE